MKAAEIRHISAKRWSRLLYDPIRHPDVEIAVRACLGDDIKVRGVDPPDDPEIVTGHGLDDARASPEMAGYCEVAPVVPQEVPDDDPERLSIMVIDGELAEADAREMMRAAPT